MTIRVIEMEIFSPDVSLCFLFSDFDQRPGSSQVDAAELAL